MAATLALEDPESSGALGAALTISTPNADGAFRSRGRGAGSPAWGETGVLGGS
jgi:hypothetical protein